MPDPLDSILACKNGGGRADQNGNCSNCGGDLCVTKFDYEGMKFGMYVYGAHFLSHELWNEIKVTQDQYVRAERNAGFYPKHGLGPEATAGFGTSDGVSGSHKTIWFKRDEVPTKVHSKEEES